MASQGTNTSGKPGFFTRLAHVQLCKKLMEVIFDFLPDRHAIDTAEMNCTDPIYMNTILRNITVRKYHVFGPDPDSVRNLPKAAGMDYEAFVVPHDQDTDPDKYPALSSNLVFSTGLFDSENIGSVSSLVRAHFRLATPGAAVIIVAKSNMALAEEITRDAAPCGALLGYRKVRILFSKYYILVFTKGPEREPEA